jgi:Fe-Mn family superoxide dismutase
MSRPNAAMSEPDVAPAVLARYSLPRLSYAFDALEPILSAEALELHYHKHHGPHTKGANDALDKLAEARRRNDCAKIQQFEKDLTFNLSGHLLHSLLWRNMSPKGGGRPHGRLAEAIDLHLGSFDAFKAHLTSAAASIQGSGWGALSWEPHGKRLLVEQLYDHQSNVGNATLPILVVDMWEHAYYLQYRNRKSAWLGNFWDLVDWTDVGSRFEKVRHTDIGL